MPRLDNTGPLGEGKMTGRGMGNCEDTSQDEKDKDIRFGVPGRGRGMGRGMGRGIGRGIGRGRFFNNSQNNDQN